MVTTNRDRQVATILERSICITLEVHILGNERKVDVEAFVDAAAPEHKESGAALAIDAEQFRATLKLIPQAEVRPVLRVQNRAKAYLRSMATSTHRVFGDRSYLVPLALLDEVVARLREFRAEVQRESAALALRYDAAVEAQRRKLGPLFRPDQYRTAVEVARAYTLDWDYVSFAVPDRLETVSATLAEEAQAKHRAKLAAAYDEVLVGLRASALDIVSDLEARLTPTADGKRRTIRDTALRDLEAFAAVLPSRNLTDDAALARVMDRLRKRAAGFDVETLRDSDAARETLRAAVGEAKATLAALVSESRRGISFGELVAASGGAAGSRGPAPQGQAGAALGARRGGGRPLGGG